MAAKTEFRCSNPKCLKLKPRVEFHEAKATDRTRDVTSQCRECRSASYFNRRYPNQCLQCLVNKPLDKNGKCKKCNEECGLRQCLGCGELLLSGLSFYGRKRRCRTCAKQERKD